MDTLLRLADYPRVVFFTGAGISAESGVPTYRGAGGIWAEYRWQEHACQRAFDRDPRAVLDFHEQRRARVRECEPNAAHRHIAALQAEHLGTSVITQNTDGLHARAGSRDVVELHGSLWRVRCPEHGVADDLAEARYARRECPRCGRALRPDITWFEDAVDPVPFARAESLIRDCDLFVAVGTSGSVWPAAGLIRAANDSNVRMVEVNVDDTALSVLFHERWRGPAAQLLPRRIVP